jgi:hypothetical protein
MSCLVYLHEHDYPWNEMTCIYAVRSGRLDGLKYAHQHGCLVSAFPCVTAAGYRRIACLGYLVSNNCPEVNYYLGVALIINTLALFV